MIKVLTVWGNYLSNSIGPSQTLKRMIRDKERFINENIDYRVISLDSNQVPSQKKASKGILSRIKKNQNSTAVNFLGQKTVIFTLASFYFKYWRYSISILKKWRGDTSLSGNIIVFHDLITFLTCRKYAQKQNAQLILFYHGDKLEESMFYDYYPAIRKFKKGINKYIFSSFSALDAIVFINPESYHNARSKYSSLVNKFKLVQNGIDDLNPNRTLKQINRNKLNLVSVGTVNERKNQLLILKALEKALPKLSYELKITIVGDGPLLQTLKKYSGANNLTDHIEFVGNQKNVIPFLLDADVFILSSNKEGLPLSVVEALSFGLPVLATNLPGVRVCVEDGINGLLFEPTDAKGLAGFLCSLLEHDLEAFGVKSRKLFEERFRFSQMQDSYINLLNDL